MEREGFEWSVSNKDKGNRPPAPRNVPCCVGKTSETTFEELHDKNKISSILSKHYVLFRHG